MNMFSQDMQLIDGSMQSGIINTVEGKETIRNK